MPDTKQHTAQCIIIQRVRWAYTGSFTVRVQREAEETEFNFELDFQFY